MFPKSEDSMYEDYLTTICTPLVEYPDALTVLVTGEDTCICEIHAHPEDIGRLIGKRGKMATALRTLLSAVGARNEQHVVLEIVE